MSNYSRGAALERELVRYLRGKGWEAARSASSKSAIDVWAVRGGQVRLYQCSLKRTAAKLRAVEEASGRLGIPVRLITRADILGLSGAA